MNLPIAYRAAPFAHRALHNVNDGRPENSRAAINAAIAAGYGIEIDLQLSADGAAMVFHDDALDRLCHASGAIRRHTSDALAQIRLRGADEGVPTLLEVLDLVAGRVPLLIELKDQDGAMGPDIGQLEQATARAIENYKGDVALMSFNPHSVAMMRDLLPDVARGLVTSAYHAKDWRLSAAIRDRLRDIPDYDTVGACFISHEVEDLHRVRVSELKEGGAFICCWTVCSHKQEVAARRIADNITFERYLAPLTA